jgi:hypothetical protein
MPSRELFVRNLEPADGEYNIATLLRLHEFIRESGNKRPGKLAGITLKESSISGILSTLHAHLACLAGGPLYNPGANASLLKAGKQMRAEDGPPGDRAIAAPLRARHLRSAFASGRLDRTSPVGRARAACLLLCHNLLARGRDVGVDASSRTVDPSRDLTIAAFDWAAGAALSPPALVVWLHPSKDPQQRKRRYPMLIQRRSSNTPFLSDPMCTFDALVDAWAVLAAPIPKAAWPATPFFRIPANPTDAPRLWKPIVSDDVGVWVKEAALAAEIDPAPLGVRALRMGGATDLYDIYGPPGERLIRERGRWSSDIAQIYQRVSAAAHGQLSRSIGDSAGVDLQSLLAGWSQSSATHGRCPL